MDTDVAIVGGGFAGLSAALQLARARRRVTVFDTGTPRNRFAAASHGFLTRDGVPPHDILAEARRQILAYPTIRIVDSAVRSVTGEADAFEIRATGRSAVTARRVVLAYGVSDTLPDIPGLREQWGRRVAHCPYCHGYEFDGRPLGVIASMAGAYHQAMLVREWGPVTLFTNDALALEADQRAELARRDIAIESAAISSIAEQVDGLSVHMAIGGSAHLAGLFVQPRSRPSAPIADDLGCVMVDGPFGPVVKVDDMKRTSVAGVFAAGDLARPAGNVSLNVADGTMAGSATHQSLVFG